MRNEQAQRAPGSAAQDWPTARFGEVVRQVKDNADPESSGLTRYVAGEHMVTDELRIRRWGTIGDGYLGPAFHRHFKAGQVLYGSRRTYLRKVAVPDFAGICANTTFVCEPADDRVLAEFLPFVMQAETFHAHSIARSKGSVNPYVNWRDIASYCFHLPPVSEQRRLVALFRSALAVAHRWEAAVAAFEVVKHAAVDEWLRTQVTEDQWARLGDALAEVKYGTSVKCGEVAPGLVPVLRIPNVVRGDIDFSDLKWAQLSDGDRSAYALEAGDLLVVRTNGNPEYVGRCSVVEELDADYAFASYLLRLRVRDGKLRARYLWLLLGHPRIRRSMAYLARSSAGNYNLSAKGLVDLSLPMPPVRAQDDILRRAADIERAQRAAANQQRRSVALTRLLRENCSAGTARAAL